MRPLHPNASSPWPNDDQAEVVEPTSGTSTFLFTDIESSAAAWETWPDMADRVRRHLTILEESVETFGGVVFATMGDGIAAAFPSATAAVRAAVLAQRSLPSTGLHARIGLHTGEAERVGRDHRGRAVNRAARIMSMGHGGQILLSDLCASIIRNGPDPVDLVEIGWRRLRGLHDPERLWQVVDGSRRSFPPVGGRMGEPPRSPQTRTPLLGRARDADRIAERMRRARLVTLTGTGGVGKTRLAVHVAEATAATRRHVVVGLAKLAAGATSTEVADAVAAAVGVGVTNDAIGAIAAMFDQDDVLLVVDNCEHVIEGAAAVIGELLGRGPRIAVLATSREPLGIDGEHIVRVEPLELDAAAALFCQRAEAAGALPGAIDRAVSLEIVRRLDGLPLAIELAAARAGSLGLRAIADSLRISSPLSGRARRGSVGRQATMGAAIAWSFDLLSTAEQRLLSWLSVFPDGAEIDAVSHVAGRLGIVPSAAIDDLASLVERSMIVTDSGRRQVRYRMLETMRAFLLERLDETGEREQARLAHADWMASITDVSFDEPCGPQALTAAVRLEREADSWREAMLVAADHELAELAARLCGPPTAFFLLGRHDLADHVRSVVELCHLEPAHRRPTLCALMVSAAGTTDPTQLQDWADEMVSLDERQPTGLSHLMKWLSGLWNGDVPGAVATCLDGADDRRLAATTRDLLLGIAVLDHFSLTGETADPDGLAERALRCADRSPVALTRVACRLGAAWALAPSAPNRSIHLLQLAMADIDDVPALTRLTLPGSAFRLLARMSPGVAARGLLDQLDTVTSLHSFMDLIPLSYARAFLGRTFDTAASVNRNGELPPTQAHLSMMDVVESARHLASGVGSEELRDLEARVRRSLIELAQTSEPGGAQALVAAPGPTAPPRIQVP